MANSLPESLLEMFYFLELKDRFSQILGTENFHILKPSTRMEHWYGFDQGYVSAAASRQDIEANLRKYLHHQYPNQQLTLRAFFLQFKVVEKLTRISHLTPEDWKSPYYRSAVSMRPSKETGISQHETLRRASTIGGAAVSYVCPMIFSEEEVLSDPRFSDLKFVDVRSAPDDWDLNVKHHICFRRKTSLPVWKSKPVEGKLVDFEELFKSARPFPLEDLDAFLERTFEALDSGSSEGSYAEQDALSGGKLFPSSLMLLVSPEG